MPGGVGSNPTGVTVRCSVRALLIQVQRLKARASDGGKETVQVTRLLEPELELSEYLLVKRALRLNLTMSC